MTGAVRGEQMLPDTCQVRKRIFNLTYIGVRVCRSQAKGGDAPRSERNVGASERSRYGIWCGDVKLLVKRA